MADTHVGEALPELPPAVLERLAGVDLILHAGDITDLAALRPLRDIAPVLAVQGDHDREGGIELPRSLVVRVGRHRIGLTHGRRSHLVEYPAAAATLLSRRLVLLGFHRAMRRRFGAVDAVVHGHLHVPVNRRIGGVLHFSPGAVHVPERSPQELRAHLKGRAYLRVRRGLPPEARRPAVGVLDVRPSGLTARVLPLGR